MVVQLHTQVTHHSARIPQAPAPRLGRGTTGLVHGDDLVFSGWGDDLDWAANELANTTPLKVMGQLGDGMQDAGGALPQPGHQVCH